MANKEVHDYPCFLQRFL